MLLYYFILSALLAIAVSAQIGNGNKELSLPFIEEAEDMDVAEAKLFRGRGKLGKKLGGLKKKHG